MFRTFVARSSSALKIFVAFAAALTLLAGSHLASSTASAATLNSASRGNLIVTIAYRYVGYPYRYGGSSPRGFDCSGFSSYVYKTAGISIGRTAAAQYSSGPHVSRANLQPG